MGSLLIPAVETKVRSMARRRPRKRPESRPTAAVVLLLLGGIFILVLGSLTLIFAALGATVSPILGGITGLSGALGTVSGLIIIISGIKIYSGQRSSTEMWSIFALVFSFVSLVNLGGFGIGFLLALIGSILALAHVG